ncbi:MAG: hypothetical protein E7214_13850 [Clostridium sp.]|nr:hypothetical protein [Clostridium sp.]
MKNFFLHEFKRCFFSKETLFGMIVVLLCLVIPYLNEIRIPYLNADACIYFIRIRTSLPDCYYPVLMPIIACIPAATKYIIDKKSGILNYILLKIRRKDYIKVRLIVNILVSGLMSVIPQIIVLIFLLLKYKINDTEMEVWGAFNNIFYDSRLLYAIILIIIAFVSSAVFSTFALGISAIVENKYLTILIPFVYMIISGTIFELIGINKIFSLNTTILFMIDCTGDLTTSNVIIYQLILLCIGIGMFNYFGEKKNYE